jgi:hypothetical protein
MRVFMISLTRMNFSYFILHDDSVGMAVVQWVPEAHNRRGWSLESDAKLKYVWSCTSTPPHVFMNDG